MRLAVDCATRRIAIGPATFPCEIGRDGAIAAIDKREGDGRTPMGDWPLRGVLLRPDRDIVPPSRLPWRWLRRSDGWCDDPQAPAAYNRPVRHPACHSAERLWRDDRLYDAIVILGHNDVSPMPGAGSAIFLHLAGPGATAGCIGVEPRAMTHLLAGADAHTSIVIR